MASTQGVALNPGTGSMAPAAVPDVPKDVKWGDTKEVVKSTVPGGSIYKVTYVNDGDGVSLKGKDGSNLTCRINQIDAPEVAHKDWTTSAGKKILGNPDQAFGQESKKNLEQMILDKEVTVLVTQEKAGRKYCEVEFQGKSLALSQVQAGLAMVYDRFVTADRAVELKSAEAQAKAARKGLWKDLNPMSGEQFRRTYNP